MHAAADRLEFAPPPPPGMLRAFVLAVIAHLLLLLALTYGLRWQRVCCWRICTCANAFWTISATSLAFDCS